MKLLTPKLRKTLPKFGTYKNRPWSKVPIHVKFFSPIGFWTWYVIEGEEKDDGDVLFFGYICGYANEFSYFSLFELESIRAFGLKLIERDMGFGRHMVSELRVKGHNL